MDLDTLLKAIVPLAFLAIWALTAVFNKEGNSLPARSQGPPNPYGPRPVVPPRVAAPSDRPPPQRNLAPRRMRPKPAPTVAAKPAPIVPAKLGLGNVSQTVNQQLATPM